MMFLTFFYFASLEMLINAKECYGLETWLFLASELSIKKLYPYHLLGTLQCLLGTILDKNTGSHLVFI